MSIRSVHQTSKASAAFFVATPDALKLSPEKLQYELGTWWQANAVLYPNVTFPKLMGHVQAAIATHEWRAGASGQGPIESMLFN